VLVFYIVPPKGTFVQVSPASAGTMLTKDIQFVSKITSFL